MIIDSQTQIALKLHIISMRQVTEQYAPEEQERTDIINSDSTTAMKVFTARHQLIAHLKDQLSAIRELCPGGLKFIDILSEWINAWEEINDHLEAMRNFRQTRLDTSNKDSMEKAREMILRNRVNASRYSSLGKDLKEMLLSETGLDIDNC